MSAADFIAELPHLAPEDIAAVRRMFAGLPSAVVPREIPGTGVRPPGYDRLFGCMDDAAGLEIPERHHWRPAPRFD